MKLLPQMLSEYDFTFKSTVYALSLVTTLVTSIIPSNRKNTSLLQLVTKLLQWIHNIDVVRSYRNYSINVHGYKTGKDLCGSMVLSKIQSFDIALD